MELVSTHAHSVHHHTTTHVHHGAHFCNTSNGYTQLHQGDTYMCVKVSVFLAPTNNFGIKYTYKTTQICTEMHKSPNLEPCLNLLVLLIVNVSLHAHQSLETLRKDWKCTHSVYYCIYNCIVVNTLFQRMSILQK